MLVYIAIGWKTEQKDPSPAITTLIASSWAWAEPIISKILEITRNSSGVLHKSGTCSRRTNCRIKYISIFKEAYLTVCSLGCTVKQVAPYWFFIPLHFSSMAKSVLKTRILVDSPLKTRRLLHFGIPSFPRDNAMIRYGFKLIPFSTLLSSHVKKRSFRTYQI